MEIKTTQTITISETEARRINRAMDFVENLICETSKFTVGDNGKMINEYGTTIVSENDLVKTYNTLNNLLWFLGDINDDRTTPISFIG